jgi:ZIP family zinc transporter
VGEAVLWAFVASATLLAGAAIALLFHPGTRTTGVVLAFGCGALISAAAFDLVLEALESRSARSISVSLFVGGITYAVGDYLISRGGGGNRKRSTGEQAEGSPLAIVLGAALDGVPESIVLALSVLLGGAVSTSFLVATALSNIPEAMAATTGLDRAGWTRGAIFRLWGIVVAISTLSAAIGYLVFDAVESATGAHIQAFAAGAVLTMVADTMLPEAFQESGKRVGLATLAGFTIALLLSQGG